MISSGVRAGAGGSGVTPGAGGSGGGGGAGLPDIPNDFAYTGGSQSVVVPTGYNKATLETWGASGGAGQLSNSVGGFGNYMAIEIVGLVPGETLYVYVGQVGYPNSGGNAYNGGGDGNNDYRDGGGGGGGTDIRRGGTALANRILVSGGGGGGEGHTIDLTGSHGGHAGYPVGFQLWVFSGYQGAGGGTQAAGGTGSPAGGGRDGSLGQGGNGGNTSNFYSPGGGGGGGGLYGGGAGSNNAYGGGGGSGYYDTTDPDVTLVTAETEGTWSGNGKARITFTG